MVRTDPACDRFEAPALGAAELEREEGILARRATALQPRSRSRDGLPRSSFPRARGAGRHSRTGGTPHLFASVIHRVAPSGAAFPIGGVSGSFSE